MNNDIAIRLRKFGESKYEKVKDFAAALDMSTASLQVYLRAKAKPGAPMLSRLAELGCDIRWLLTGVSEDERKKELQKEVDDVWHKLEKLGIKSKKNFDALFAEDQYMMVAKDVIAMAKEKQEKYGKKK